MFNRIQKFLAVLILLPIALTACATNSNPDSNTNPAPVREDSEGGAEAALVTYSDSQLGFSIGYPGPWTQDKTFTTGVKFIGGDDLYDA